MSKTFGIRSVVVPAVAAMLLVGAACGGTETIEVPGETVVVEKEVIRTVEVPGKTVVQEVVKEVQVPGETVVVEREVVKEVQVPGETVVVEKVVRETVQVPGETVVVEKEVVKTVEVPGETVVVEKEVVQTVEIVKEVPVEKLVTVVKEVTVEVIKEPEQPPVAAMGPPIYQMGIFEEPITRNFWNYYGGPGGSVWTQYVLDGHAGSMYGYSDKRFDWIPSLASDFPTPLTRENVGGTEFWTAEVPLLKGVMWSDGEEFDSGDVVFTVQTALDLQLGSNWAAVVDSAFLDRVEALDSHRIKVFFKSTDAEGNPQTPGLSVWQFGLGFMPILAEHYWASVIEEVKSAGEIEQQHAALFAYVPDGEPTIGGYVFKKWEPGAFYEKDTDPNFFFTGTVITEYESGAYAESNERTGHSAMYYGEASGAKTLEYEVGPHVESAIFSIYGNQDAAILALTTGDIDYVFNPLGLEKGFLDRVKSTPDLQVAGNPNNGVRYLGFNVRKAPMNIKEFRQAIATVIDKEFVTSTILQDAAIPVYAMVPEGNGFWHNSDVPKFGQGMSRGERIAAAVELLKSTGFTYEEEPQISDDGNFVSVPGKGLKMPDGTPVPEMEMLAPSAGYDPMRSTFAIWVERWMNDIGIPVRAKLTGFNVIVGELFSETVAEDLDMWILGWGLSIFPDYLENFFNTRHSPEIGAGYNWGGYSNSDFDELSTGLLSETTIEGARDKIYKLQEFLAEELPYVTLFTTPKLDAYRPSRIEFPYTAVLGGLEQQGGMQQEAVIK